MNVEENLIFVYENLKKEVLSTLPPSYEVIQKKYWMVYKNEYQLPSQGWKVHLSFNFNDFLEKFIEISSLLFELDLNWKVPRTLMQLKEIISGTLDTAITGKVFTIYPLNEKQFIKTIEVLYEKVNPISKPPIIITDKRYKNSECIYYRYGGIKSKYIYDEKVRKFIPVLINPIGELVEDKRVHNFYKPEWISDPFE